MLASYARAFAQLAERSMRGIIIRALIATVLLFVLLHLATWWGLRHLHLFGISWLDSAADWLGTLGVWAVTWMLFPGIASLVLGFLLDGVARAVEAHYYPGQPPPRRQSLWEIAWGAVRFAAVTLLANLIALPIYLFLLAFGIGIGLYYIVNGYLLAREYFELVAWRRLTPTEAEALRRAHLGRLWVNGIVMALLATVPFVNLIAPVIGTAAMVHEFERLRRNARLL